MASDTSTIRLRAGVAAVLLFLLYAIQWVWFLSSGIGLQPFPIERGALQNFLPIMAAHPTVLTILFWMAAVWNILIAIFGIDLYRILVDDRSGLLFAPVALIGGAGLFIIELLLMIGIIQGLAPAYVGATGAEQAAIEAVALALLLFRNRMLLIAAVLWYLAAIIFGREMLRSTEFPDWMGYGGYAIGVVGVIGGFFPVFLPLLIVLGLVQVVFFLWILSAGIILLRNR